MNDPYLGQTTDMILGQEFLTWLWFRAETQPLGFRDKDGQSFTLTLEQRIVVQGGEGEALETASVSGSLSQLREVRLGLQTGKKVTRALVRFEKDELAWQTLSRQKILRWAVSGLPKSNMKKMTILTLFFWKNCI